MTVETAAGRADARRNRETVLRTAIQVFAEDGLEVSLSRIARRAGVGAGTVYRHFPSKDMLVEAVLTDHLETLVRAADRWSGRAAPGEALFSFLLEVIDRSAGRGAVCDALDATRGWPHTALAAAAKRFHEALARLLREAKIAGAVRAEIQADDLAALAAGGVALRSAHRSRARSMRLVRLLLEGLRPPAVTERGEFRDKVGVRGHETATAQRCLQCGAGLPVRATGRPPSYCGPTCRQRARRRRLAGRRAPGSGQVAEPGETASPETR